jgi:hypothetical protein
LEIFGDNLLGGECGVAGYVNGKGDVDVSEDDIKAAELSEFKWGNT